MKPNKLILILTALTFVLGCSKSDDNPPVEPVVETNPLRVSNYKVGTTSYDVFYDDDFKPILIEGPNDNLEIEYNSDGLISKHGDYQYTYDASGKISTVIDLDPFASTTDVETSKQNYDSSGKLIEIISSTPNSFIVNGGEYIQQSNFFYDTANRLVEIIRISNATNNSIRKFELEYDANSNINKITESSSQDGSNYTIDATFQYVYDTNKNPERLFLKLANVSGDFIRFSPLQNSVWSEINLAGLAYIPKNNVISTTMSLNTTTVTEISDITYDTDYPIIAEREFTRTNGTQGNLIATWSYEGEF